MPPAASHVAARNAATAHRRIDVLESTENGARNGRIVDDASNPLAVPEKSRTRTGICRIRARAEPGISNMIRFARHRTGGKAANA